MDTEDRQSLLRQRNARRKRDFLRIRRSCQSRRPAIRRMRRALLATLAQRQRRVRQKTQSMKFFCFAKLATISLTSRFSHQAEQRKKQRFRVFSRAGLGASPLARTVLRGRRSRCATQESQMNRGGDLRNFLDPVRKLTLEDYSRWCLFEKLLQQAAKSYLEFVLFVRLRSRVCFSSSGNQHDDAYSCYCYEYYFGQTNRR